VLDGIIDLEINLKYRLKCKEKKFK